MRRTAAIARRATAPPGWQRGVFVLVTTLLPACIFDLAPLETGAGGDGGAGGGCMIANISVDPDNRTVNPSFEDGTDDWEGHEATLTVIETADALEGNSVVRVAYTGDTASGDSYSISDAPDTFQSSVAGATYRVSAWVRSAGEPNAEARVQILLNSDQEDDFVKSPELEIGPCFTKIEASGVAREDGYGIGVLVKQLHRAPGDAFDVEMIQVFEELPGGG